MLSIGEISCVLVDSCSNIVENDNYVFVVLQENDKLMVLKPELLDCDSDFVVSGLLEDFIIHTTPVRLTTSVYGVATVRLFASRLFVGKKTTQVVFTINNKLHHFQLHDESTMDFDPNGNLLWFVAFFYVKFPFNLFLRFHKLCYRLWWIP